MTFLGQETKKPIIRKKQRYDFSLKEKENMSN